MSKQGGIEPGSLHGIRPTRNRSGSDAEIISEVARMNADEFKAKFIKGPDAERNMSEYRAAVERHNNRKKQ